MKLGTYTANQASGNYYLDQAKNSEKKALNAISANSEIKASGANLQIAESLLSQTNVLNEGMVNANDMIGMLQIADSTLLNLSESADKIGELSSKLSNPALSANEQKGIKGEINALKNAMSDSVKEAKFNGKNVFDAELGFFTGEGTKNINLSTNALLNVKEDGSNSGDILKNINSLRSEIGSTQNAVFRGMNALAARSVANANSVENLDSSDIAKSLEKNLQANLKLHAASLAKAHDTTSLAAKLDKLLGE